MKKKLCKDSCQRHSIVSRWESAPHKQSIEEILAELEEWEFIENHNRTFVATKLGKRISELI